MLSKTLTLLTLAGGLAAAAINEDFSAANALAAWQATTPAQAANQIAQPRGNDNALVIGARLLLTSQATLPTAPTVTLGCTAKLESAGQICFGLRAEQTYPPAYELRISGDGRVVVRRLEAAEKESSLATYTAPAATSEVHAYTMVLTRKEGLIHIEVRQDAAVLGGVDDSKPLDLGTAQRVVIRNWKETAAGWIDEVRAQTP